LEGKPMSRKITPEELVDAEIERLKKTDAVKLAQKEQRLLYRKRKYLADLRWLEKRGKALMAEGWTLDTLELLFRDIPEE
jgi:L-fucose isomerase-like protein